MIALIAASALAGFPGDRVNECCFVVGASVVVALGEVEGSRVGGGLDLGYQAQRYTHATKQIEGDLIVWAEEHPALNYGPVAHVWRVGGAWNASFGARFGVGWPLRMGLGRGWYPGPAVTVELAPALSTAGWFGLDGQLALDAPWVQGRVGTALTGQGWRARRVSMGPFAVLGLPRNWPGIPNYWDEPEPGDPVPPNAPEWP